MLTTWITAMLSGRTTTLSFDDYESPSYEVLSGLDQGCPLSPVLFAYYTASLMEKLEGQRDKAALSYVDDINLLTAGYSFADANAKAEMVIDGGERVRRMGTRAQCALRIREDRVCSVCSAAI